MDSNGFEWIGADLIHLVWFGLVWFGLVWFWEGIDAKNGVGYF